MLYFNEQLKTVDDYDILLTNCWLQSKNSFAAEPC